MTAEQRPQVEALIDGPDDASRSLILAHGAGQGPCAAFMQHLTGRISAAGVRVVRPWFPYMAKTAADGRRRPPDREPKLTAALRDVILAEYARGSAVAVGGKSMGGRIAAILADELAVSGLICFGFPFHAPGKPDRTRLVSLTELKTPAVIFQGERDPFGNRAEVEAYPLSDAVQMAWIGDGEHSFKPRKSSGRTWEQNLDEAADLALEFMSRLG